MAFSVKKEIENFLKKNLDQKYTAQQIAEWIFETYPKESNQKRERSKNKNIKNLKSPEERNKFIISIFKTEISSLIGRDTSGHIKIVNERPKKYYYTEKNDQKEIEILEIVKDNQDKINFPASEVSLYPKLKEFLWDEYQIYSMRIDDKKSSNTKGQNGNQWLYPDIVAMEDLIAQWHSKTKDCVREYADKKAKLWSFEVKIRINRSNLRQAFFQTVSNSSWANYGYLVASELEGADTQQELSILCGLHGIGFILLKDTPSESYVLIPAKERSEIDWNTVNRIIEENKDFERYIEEVIRFYKNDKTKKSDWEENE